MSTENVEALKSADTPYVSFALYLTDTDSVTTED